jgi:hypothetical protein
VISVAVAVALLPAGVVSQAAAPTHTYKVWRIERIDRKPHRLKVSVAVGAAKPGAFFGDIAVKRVGRRDVPYRVFDNAIGYGYMFESGRQGLIPTADVDEGPVRAASPSCADLGLGLCQPPVVPGLTATMTPNAVGWFADTPLAHDLYAVIYDMTIEGAPKFDKAYPGWRAVPVPGVSVTVVTRQQAEATGVSDGDDTVEHFHRASVSSGRGYSVVQAILPCFGTSRPGVGSARLTNTLGISVTLDCDHPIYVAASSRRTDWTFSGDVIGYNEGTFPYSRLIETNFPA